MIFFQNSETYERICTYTSQTNLKVLFSNTQNLTTIDKQQHTYIKYKTDFKDTLILFTDGSKNDGIGIYIDHTAETISLKINQNLSRHFDLIAIIISSNVTSKYEHITHIILFTHSKSSLQSILETIEQKNNKYYENKII